MQRTTDAGKTWQRLNTGLVNTSIMHLVAVQGTLYANIGHALLSSSDGGESWDPVPNSWGNVLNMIEFNGVLYFKGVEGRNPRIFRLSAEDNGLTRIPSMPNLGNAEFDSEQFTEDINLALLESIEGEDEIDFEKGERLNPEQFDVDKFNEAYSGIMEKIMTNAFALSFWEFRYWRWHLLYGISTGALQMETRHA